MLRQKVIQSLDDLICLNYSDEMQVIIILDLCNKLLDEVDEILSKIPDHPSGNTSEEP